MLHNGSRSLCNGPARSAPALPSGLRRGLATAGLLLASLATAQPASAPTVIEVQRGDTFSAIAARYVGDAKNWATLYDRKLSGLANPNVILPGQRFELVESDGRKYLRLAGAGTQVAAAAPAAAPAPAAKPAPPAPATAAAPAPRPAPAPAPAPSPAPAPAAPPPVAAAAPAPAPAPAASGELVVGVLPNISATALMAQYEFMKSYLERQGPQKVRIVLPANFKAFFDGMVRGDYDIAISAPNLARVAQLDAKLVPLAMYEPRIAAQFITPIDNPIPSVKDAKGKAIAFANPQSLVALYGRQWLMQQGLEVGKDYEQKGARTDMGVGRMLLSGDAVAAIMSNGEFRALPPEESARLKIVEVFARIPNFIILGHPRLGNERLGRLKSQFLGFLADKDEGSAFSKATGITAIVDIDEPTLKELDAFAAPTRRAMGVGN